MCRKMFRNLCLKQVFFIFLFHIGLIDKEQQVQGSVNVKGVNCREGEILGSCCPPNCEATCYRPNVDSFSGTSQNRRGSSCIEKCVCKKPLVRGMDRKCVPVSQCPGKNGSHN